MEILSQNQTRYVPIMKQELCLLNLDVWCFI